MIALMFKPICATTLLVFCFVGCSSQQAPSAPAKDPSGVEMEFHEPEETEAEAAESESEEAEATEAEGGDAEAAEAESKPAQRQEPPKKSCDGLAQKTCEITVGCAWSTDKKCVEQ
jgi:hypothetical protein